MNPRHSWQRQPGEAPADFTAFVTYLRLKGRRSRRLVAARAGRSITTIRRLSVRFNWRSRVAAFEARLAEATQSALNLHVRATVAQKTADFDRLRDTEFQLVQRVLVESHRWLRLASDPRRRAWSPAMVCRVIELASRLGRLAAGLSTDHEPRRLRQEDAPGFWTGPSVEEALEKMYGSPANPASVPADAGDVVTPPQPCPVPAEAVVPPDSPVASPPADSPVPNEYRRRDAWSAWARFQRRAAAATSK